MCCIEEWRDGANVVLWSGNFFLLFPIPDWSLAGASVANLIRWCVIILLQAQADSFGHIVIAWLRVFSRRNRLTWCFRKNNQVEAYKSPSPGSSGFWISEGCPLDLEARATFLLFSWAATADCVSIVLCIKQENQLNLYRSLVDFMGINLRPNFHAVVWTFDTVVRYSSFKNFGLGSRLCGFLIRIWPSSVMISEMCWWISLNATWKRIGFNLSIMKSLFVNVISFRDFLSKGFFYVFFQSSLRKYSSSWWSFISDFGNSALSRCFVNWEERNK